MAYANCDIKLFTSARQWRRLPSYHLLPLSKPEMGKRSMIIFKDQLKQEQLIWRTIVT